MNIVFLDAFTLSNEDISMSIMSKHGQCTYYDYTTESEMPSRVANADILVVNKHQVNIDLLLNAPKLKYIVVSATGYNNIDIAACASKNIEVSNVRSYSTYGVAQYVVAAIFHHTNKLNYYHDEVAKGRWHNSRDFSFYDHSIYNLDAYALGIIGFGAIGQKLAEFLQPFDMEILVYSKYPIEDKFNFVKAATLDEIFINSDIISLHAPLNATTSNLISKSSFEKIKKDALLINTSRGGLIDEKDLAAHLTSNPTFHAMLDVVSLEPPTKQNPLFGLANCHITPHIAWASRQSRQNLLNGIAENIESFLNGTAKNRIV